MNNNLENNIKNQLENREILVSENAWEKLRDMMDEKPVERKIKPWFWIGVAASVAVIIGLFFGLNYLDPESEAQIGNPTQIVIQKTNQPVEVISNEIEIAQNEVEIEIQPHEIQYANHLKQTEILKSSKKEIWVDNSNENRVVEEIIKEYTEPKVELKEEPVMALNTDSISKPTNKTNYVDPEMLLYSVENNQAVQQKNSGSRMVLIDFNK
ncbi:MAG: hypothetical protein GX159_11490 [Flavobacteriaceae bacterium]|jgi:hypothetical protein|nr:hypothetical protein [Flavobacteriaceae bacterium]